MEPQMYEFYFYCGVALAGISFILMVLTKSLDIRGVLGFLWGLFLLFWTSGKF